jgi:SAM-dependent methyltransferase
MTDQSQRQLDSARHHCAIRGVEYMRLDAASRFPFDSSIFHLVLASMVFNEMSNKVLANALDESARVLKPGGVLLVSVIHPRFIEKLAKHRMLKRRNSRLTISGPGSLRLPVVIRTRQKYRSAQLILASGSKKRQYLRYRRF